MGIVLQFHKTPKTPEKASPKSQTWQIKIDRKKFPHIEEMISCSNPKVLEERHGICLPRNLGWSPNPRHRSQRIGVILETIARKSAQTPIRTEKDEIPSLLNQRLLFEEGER